MQGLKFRADTMLYFCTLDESEESTSSQPPFLLAVYWTRKVTGAGNTIKHGTGS